MKNFLSKIVCVMSVLSVLLCSVFAASAADYVLGDVDGDNTISVKDATKLQMHLAGIVTLEGSTEAAGDVNQNGVIDIGDVTCVQKYAARIISSFDEVAETTEQVTTEEVTTVEPTTENYFDSDGYYNIVVKP